MSMLGDDPFEDDTQPIVPPFLFCRERVDRAAELALSVFAIDCPRCRAPSEQACGEPAESFADGALNVAAHAVIAHPNAGIGNAGAMPARVPAGAGELAAFLRALRPGPVGWFIRVLFALHAALQRTPEPPEDDDANANDAGELPSAEPTFAR